MTLNLPAGAMTDAATISPLALFLQADIVVKGVMIGLLLASIWTWAMIIGFSVTLRKASKESRKFEADFWKAEDIDRFYEARGKGSFPAAMGSMITTTGFRNPSSATISGRTMSGSGSPTTATSSPTRSRLSISRAWASSAARRSGNHSAGMMASIATTGSTAKTTRSLS